MLHRFPQDEASWKPWVKIIGRDGWVPSKHSVLCSDHFTEDSFAVYNNWTKKRIKPGALPIIEPQRNISVENNCAGKKNIFFNVTKKSNKTTRKVLYDIESHFLF